MKKKIFKFPLRTTIFVFVGLFFVIIATGNQREVVSTYNINNSKYVDASNIVQLDSNGLVLPERQYVFYETFSEIVANGETEAVSFTSTLTGYGPDCVGCGGKTGCKPYQDVRDGNIFYEDDQYGKVNIVATDKNIPCGTILRLSNLYDDSIVAVVLDRGGAIVEKKIDLLFESEKDALFVGKQDDIHTEILRWGW